MKKYTGKDCKHWLGNCYSRNEW